MSVDREQVRREPTVQRQETERDAAMRWRKRAEQAERERDALMEALRRIEATRLGDLPNTWSEMASRALASVEQAQEQR